MRVTNQMMYADVLANLQLHGKKLARLQVEAGDGKKLHMPSDNFVAMGDALTLRGAIQSNQTYLNNISTAREFLSASATSLDGLSTIIQSGLAIAVRAASDTFGRSERDTYSKQVDNLVQEAVNVLNTTHREQYVFGGFKTTTVAYSAVEVQKSITAAKYNGDSGLRKVEIEPGQTLTMNVLLNQEVSDLKIAPARMLATLVNLREALRKGIAPDVSFQIGELQGDLDATVRLVGEAGGRLARLTATQERLEKVQIGLSNTLQTAEDRPMAQAVLALKQEETVYQAALATAGALNRNTLFDYLR
ncbi:MAG: hypothetical protein DWI68_00100 [Chloroflexi bacterium]|nr:MAG: hypothetical protein DWI68_00100 [Chloroflexota bacterium]